MSSTSKRISVALAGNANVGKSSLFNQLTGSSQHIGNWPGKTVEKAEGKLYYSGYEIYVVDLPGIYSLSALSIEELIARDYIASEKPDIVINVVDASALERNLYLTVQLLELEAPLLIALNQVDFAAKRGIRIDVEALERELGVKVVPTIATTGYGVDELVKAVVSFYEEGKPSGRTPRYGREVEEAIEAIEKELFNITLGELKRFPKRWIAIKLLERDSEVWGLLSKQPGCDAVFEAVAKWSQKIESIHGEPAPAIIAAERYGFITRVVERVQTITTPAKPSLSEAVDELTTHPVAGYLILACVVAGIFAAVFEGGSALSAFLESIMSGWLLAAKQWLLSILPAWAVDVLVDGVLMGFVAGLVLVIPYILPFYIILALLEDSGYLPRAAFLVDNLMHKMGLHGKAFIPLMLGFGCNVPAVMGCRIMETERERFIAGLLATFVPCAARTVVILGVVGRFLGLEWALALYFIDILVVIAVGRLAHRVAPGEPMGLIMEMPPYRKPSPSVVLRQSWLRTKDFLYIALPIIVLGSGFLEALKVAGVIDQASQAFAPAMGAILGLPGFAVVPLVFGVLRKELALVMLVEVAGTTNLSLVFTPSQMVVFSLVTMLYVPCIATVAALFKEFGIGKAALITATNLLVATALGASSFRLMELLGFS